MNEQNNQPAKSGFDITSVVAKLIPVLLYIALAFAVVGFLYYFIVGIVNAAGRSGTFGSFVSGFAAALGCVAKYGCLAGILAGVQKLLNK